MTEHERWLAERRKGIGGSDASAILGLNPWKTNVDLWEEKTSDIKPPDISGKPAVRYGIDAEAPLRELFKLDFPELDVHYDAYKLYKNNQYPFLFATLDGWMAGDKKGILEIKTTKIMNSTSWAQWKDGIPNTYYCQIIHQFIATGFDYAIVKAQIKHGLKDVRVTTKHYRFERADVQTDIDFLLEQELEFWNKYIITNKRPPLKLPPI